MFGNRWSDGDSRTARTAGRTFRAASANTNTNSRGKVSSEQKNYEYNIKMLELKIDELKLENDKLKGEIHENNFTIDRTF